MPVPVSKISFTACHVSSHRCWLQDTPPRFLLAAVPLYHAEAFMVMLPTANWTVSPLATPVMLEVSAPWSHRSGVPAESQTSIAVTVVQEPVADQDTELLLVCCPADGAPNADDPRDDPPAE